MAHRPPYDPVRPVAFLHIPKSAGTALTSALIAALAPQNFFLAIDRCMFGDFAGFERLTEAARATVIFDAEVIPRNADLLVGHLSLSVLSHASPRAQFVTVLREPTTRLISLWMFWRGLSPAFHEEWRPWGDVVRLSHLPLRDFLQRPEIACQTDNQALRLLLWPHPLIPNGDFIDERHDARLLDDALARLERFSFVDVIENPSCNENLAAWLGRPVVVARFNETPGIPESLKTPLADELDPDTSARIASLSRLDAILWSMIVTQQIPDLDRRTVRDRTVAKTLSNYARLMTPAP